MCFLDVITIGTLLECSVLNNIDKAFLDSAVFRGQQFEEELIHNLSIENSSIIIGNYLLDHSTLNKDIEWEKAEFWDTYLKYCDSIWKDIKYFPVAESTMNRRYTVSYVDTWGAERNYGGERKHEGCDVIPTVGKAGIYPIVSVTDGVVTNIGWLENGGYRIGITSPSGGYFYYAHLDSYSNVSLGDEVMAGELLGYMGNTGYGEEGTTGMFITHLHFGIYINVSGKEISVNPYWILRFLDSHKLKYDF